MPAMITLPLVRKKELSIDVKGREAVIMSYELSAERIRA